MAALTGACASTGARPRPFPTPAPRAQSAPPPTAAATPEPATVQPETPVAPPPAENPAASRPSLEASALAGTALMLRGTPYRNGGSDPRGFDCSGFTQYVFARYGIPLPRAVTDQFEIGEPVELDAVAPGDLLFFTTVAPGASHVAIAIGGDQFVHAPSSSGVVRVERTTSTYWAPRLLAARRILN